MVRSRTMTAPTNLRGQVERDATTCAMFMKYWSQGTRSSIAPFYQNRPQNGQKAPPSATPATARTPTGRRAGLVCCSIPRAVDWKATRKLPKTEFPMRADVARREPEWLARWARERQYERLLDARRQEEAEAFVLHDGPPYPTGGIHYGTVLNKVLKDIVVRSPLLMGKRAVFRPGWDCHGLPIEQQVEKELGKDAKALDAAAFRERCQSHALKFVDVMRGEFKRLGCLGLWDDPYLTLSKDYEATIARQLAGFVRR